MRKLPTSFGPLSAISRARCSLHLQHNVIQKASICQRFLQLHTLPTLRNYSRLYANYARCHGNENKGNNALRINSLGLGLQTRFQSRAASIGSKRWASNDSRSRPDRNSNTNANTKTEYEKPTWDQVKSLFALARPYKKRLLLGVLLITATSLVSLSIPKLIGLVIDVSSEISKTPEVSPTYFGYSSTVFFSSFIGLLIFGAACNFMRLYVMRTVGESIVARFRSRAYEKLLKNDASFFDANMHGDIISRLSTDASIVGRSVSSNIGEGMRGSLQCLLGLGAMLYISPSLTGKMLLVVPPIAVLGLFYGVYVRKMSKLSQERLADLVRLSEEKLANIRIIQAFNREKYELCNYNNGIRRFYNIVRKEIIATGGFQALSSFMANTSITLILMLGGTYVSQGIVSSGDLMSFFLYTLFVGGSLSTLSSVYSEIMKGAGAASRLFQIIERTPSISPHKGLNLQARLPKGCTPSIQFKNVSFSYPTRPSVPIFKNLNLDIRGGEHVAICGASGGGKSTILALLLRLYDPTKGQILLSESLELSKSSEPSSNSNFQIDIRDCSVKSLRTLFSVVTQDPVLFSGTIFDNIAYGKADATHQEIEQAAKLAHCDFIQDLPDGLNTIVGTRGTQLSGGQRQRVAIARAFIRNPKILILDEATSALDGSSEVAIDRALNELVSTREMTTITIAHRLATIKKADKILVLGTNGEIIESGTFQQLSKRGTYFSELMKLQLF